MKISIIIPVKGRLSHLKQTIDRVAYQFAGNDEIEVIVVDYQCPDGSGEWVRRRYPRVTVTEANVGELDWSLSGARNLGYKRSTGDILLFLDADAIISPTFVHDHIDMLVPGSFICGWGWRDATGCLMVYRDAFELVKGYNECIQTWGMEDIDIYTRLEKDLAHERRNWIGGIETIKHGDEWRNYFHGGKDPMKTNEENYHITQNQFKGI